MQQRTYVVNNQGGDYSQNNPQSGRRRTPSYRPQSIALDGRQIVIDMNENGTVRRRSRSLAGRRPFSEGGGYVNTNEFEVVNNSARSRSRSLRRVVSVSDKNGGLRRAIILDDPGEEYVEVKRPWTENVILDDPGDEYIEPRARQPSRQGRRKSFTLDNFVNVNDRQGRRGSSTRMASGVNGRGRDSSQTTTYIIKDDESDLENYQYQRDQPGRRRESFTSRGQQQRGERQIFIDAETDSETDSEDDDDLVQTRGRARRPSGILTGFAGGRVDGVTRTTDKHGKSKMAFVRQRGGSHSRPSSARAASVTGSLVENVISAADFRNSIRADLNDGFDTNIDGRFRRNPSRNRSSSVGGNVGGRTGGQGDDNRSSGRSRSRSFHNDNRPQFNEVGENDDYDDEFQQVVHKFKIEIDRNDPNAYKRTRPTKTIISLPRSFVNHDSFQNLDFDRYALTGKDLLLMYNRVMSRDEVLGAVQLCASYGHENDYDGDGNDIVRSSDNTFVHFKLQDLRTDVVAEERFGPFGRRGQSKGRRIHGDYQNDADNYPSANRARNQSRGAQAQGVDDNLGGFVPAGSNRNRNQSAGRYRGGGQAPLSPGSIHSWMGNSATSNSDNGGADPRYTRSSSSNFTFSDKVARALVGLPLSCNAVRHAITVPQCTCFDTEYTWDVKARIQEVQAELEVAKQVHASQRSAQDSTKIARCKAEIEKREEDVERLRSQVKDRMDQRAQNPTTGGMAANRNRSKTRARRPEYNSFGTTAGPMGNNNNAGTYEAGYSQSTPAFPIAGGIYSNPTSPTSNQFPNPGRDFNQRDSGVPSNGPNMNGYYSGNGYNQPPGSNNYRDQNGYTQPPGPNNYRDQNSNLFGPNAPRPYPNNAPNGNGNGYNNQYI